MTASAIARSVVVVALLGVVPDAAGPPADEVGRQLQRGDVDELGAGKLLVAAPGLPDPGFARTVVLLIDFSEDGAMGLILNRRTDVPLEQLFPGLRPATRAAALAFYGGPVAVARARALLRSERAPAGAIPVVDDVHLVSVREAMDEALAIGAGLDRFRVYVGYAGWSPGQLDRETAGGGWRVLDGDGDVVFDPDPDTTWRRQVLRTETLSVRGRRERPEAEAAAH